MLATPSSSSYVLVDDVCARLRPVEELGLVDRDAIVDRLRAEELLHIGEKRILVGECDLDHAIEVYLKPGLHELFIPVHIATGMDRGLWRLTQKQRNLVVFIIMLRLGQAQPVRLGQKIQRPCTSLLSFIEHSRDSPSRLVVTTTANPLDEIIDPSRFARN